MNESIPVIRDVDHGTARLLPDVDRDRAWLLTVDGAPQSYVDLDAPDHLEFEYARRLAHIVDCAAAPGAPLDVLHLGGGALTLPRYVAAARPGSRQDVAEADLGLLALVAEHLPVPESSGITVHGTDARSRLEQTPPGSVDLLIADVFGGSRVPAHLTTVEYARAARRALRDGGIYAANLADGAPFGFLRSQLATFAAVFEELALIAEPAVLRGRALRQRHPRRVPAPRRHRDADPSLRRRRLPRQGRVRPRAGPVRRSRPAGRGQRGGRLTRAARRSLRHRLSPMPAPWPSPPRW